MILAVMLPKALPCFQQQFSLCLRHSPAQPKLIAGWSLSLWPSQPAIIHPNRKEHHMTAQNATQQPSTSPRRDIHQQVTDTIIRQLESGTVPWHQPWNGGPERLLSIPKNFNTGKKYRGINILLLWVSALDQKFDSGDWASLKQWNERKESIRKGEKGSMIVYYDTFEKEVEGEVQKIPFLKTSYVFNRCQLASYQPQKAVDASPVQSLVEKIDQLDQFVQNTNAIIEHAGSQAYYRPSQDKIVLPAPAAFIDTDNYTATEGYYSTLLHELTHWTSHPSRLNRKVGKKFGDNGYAVEELVAELGAAFLCSEFAIQTADKGNHASYIAHWLNVLKENKHCLITAASEASKACGYLQGLQPQ
jgi:antirestriction protein ArdC